MIKIRVGMPPDWEEALFEFCETVMKVSPFVENLDDGAFLNLVLEEQKAADRAIVRLGIFWDTLCGLWHTAYPFSPEISSIDKDWSKEWRRFFRVIHVSPALTVRPEWEEYNDPADARECVLVIRPKNAFGTGASATTQIALRALEKVIRPGACVLDVGTGSGILAVAAEKFGASHVDAIDNDPDVFENVAEHIRLNGCSRIRAVHADIKEFSPGRRYDVVASNLILPQIIPLVPRIAEFLYTDGRWIVSGILAEQEAEFLRMAERHGLSKRDWQHAEEWAGGTLYTSEGCK